MLPENPDPDADGEMDGYFFQASKLLDGRFRPTIRYGLLDYLDPGTQLGRSADKGDKDLTELVFSLAYYPTPKVALKAEYIVHVNGPKFKEQDEEGKLRRSVQSALRRAEEKGVKRLAFPPIGTGLYQVPLDLCARVMVDTITEHLQQDTRRG